ncbi:MAG TPA: hypothetical protein VIN07_08845 [Flavipsychrobacter sp.]
MRLFALILMCTPVMFISCNKPDCTNNREAFSKYQPDDIEYKRELGHLVDSIGKDNLRYWINSYRKQDGKDLMFTHVQNESVCAIAVFDITETTGLQHYKDVTGKGYSGAELRGVDYDVYRNETTIDFIMNNVERVID